MRWRTPSRVIGPAVWMQSPVGIYVIYPLTGTFGARHFAWVMMGLATLIDWLRRSAPSLSRIAIVAVSGGLIVPFPSYGIYGQPLTANFEAFSKAYRAGDVVLIDPNDQEATPEEWDYFTRAYFPQGLAFVTNPDGYRRVWYVTKEASSPMDYAFMARTLPGTPINT